MKKILLIIFCLCCFASSASASQYSGTFDPNNIGQNKAYLVNNGGMNNISREITVGKFTTQTNQNGTISGNTITGWMWGAATGWISLSCDNIPGSCASSNYKVAVSNDGYLSGYAWGPQAGWVNFSPTGAGSNTVRIMPSGDFVGYAWSQVFGYISFNCYNDSSCGVTDFKTYTDFRPLNYQTHSAATIPILQRITNIFKEDKLKEIEVVAKIEDKKVENVIEKTPIKNSENNTTSTSKLEVPSGEPSVSNFKPTSKPPEITKPIGSKELNKDVSNNVDEKKQADNNTKKKVGLGILGLLILIFIVTRL